MRSTSIALRQLLVRSRVFPCTVTYLCNDGRHSQNQLKSGLDHLGVELGKTLETFWEIEMKYRNMIEEVMKPDV